MIVASAFWSACLVALALGLTGWSTNHQIGWALIVAGLALLQWQFWIGG